MSGSQHALDSSQGDLLYWQLWRGPGLRNWLFPWNVICLTCQSTWPVFRYTASQQVILSLWLSITAIN